MLLISKNFLVLVTIAIIIASPLAFWAAKKWLQNFTYRIEPEWYIFIIAAIITLFITFLTVGYHSIRAAMANPTKSLRTE
jgi:putative ABC transport system permease protein